MTYNPSIKYIYIYICIYVNEIEHMIIFKIKTVYFFEHLTAKTMYLKALKKR